MIRALLYPTAARRNRALRLIVTNWILGAALGVLCATLFLAFDIAHLRSLTWHADHVAWVALALLFGGFAVTFGGIVCAAAVMTVPGSETGRPGGLGAAQPASELGLCPAPGRAPTRRGQD